MSSAESFYYQIFTTFEASIRSVGTACTLASVGIYLHRRNFILGQGKKTLALISQQVTIPLFLFSKIVYCNQDWSHEPCPDVTQSLGDIWILLLWPAHVVGCGLLVGYFAAKLSNTPPKTLKAVLAACAFGNSTGLPITLLTVVHANFPDTTELGRIDPTLFLSVYLLLYPVLQWSVGGWLLAPDDEEEEEETAVASTGTRYIRHNVLNNDEVERTYHQKRRGLSETDASMYISTVDLVGYYSEQVQREQERATAAVGGIEDAPLTNSNTLEVTMVPEERPLLPKQPKDQPLDEATTQQPQHPHYSHHSILETLEKIAGRVLQPPVIGAIMGFVVAATPLRGIFVDLVDRSSDAPLQWFFDGLYAVGQAAVPVNMIILGCNLSASYLNRQSTDKSKLLTPKTMVAIVVGKMLVMPILGILSAILMSCFLAVPDDIDAAFYLVCMIVFITPTANNVMVMVELSGSGTKEGIAQAIAWQYAAAPLILSLTMSVVVGVASHWS